MQRNRGERTANLSGERKRRKRGRKGEEEGGTGLVRLYDGQERWQEVTRGRGNQKQGPVGGGFNWAALRGDLEFAGMCSSAKAPRGCPSTAHGTAMGQKLGGKREKRGVKEGERKTRNKVTSRTAKSRRYARMHAK